MPIPLVRMMPTLALPRFVRVAILSSAIREGPTGRSPVDCDKEINANQQMVAIASTGKLQEDDSGSGAVRTQQGR